MGLISLPLHKTDPPSVNIAYETLPLRNTLQAAAAGPERTAPREELQGKLDIVIKPQAPKKSLRGPDGLTDKERRSVALLNDLSASY